MYLHNVYVSHLRSLRALFLRASILETDHMLNLNLIACKSEIRRYAYSVVSNQLLVFENAFVLLGTDTTV